MKKGTKIGLGCSLALVGIITLSGCTASFCSAKDKAHILYAFDYGVTEYMSMEEAEADSNIDSSTIVPLEIDGYTFDDVYYYADINNSECVTDLVLGATENGMREPSLEYFRLMDQVVLTHAFEAALSETDEELLEKTKLPEDGVYSVENVRDVLDNYGYIKFYDSSAEKSLDATLWANWYNYTEEVRQMITNVDDYPDADFIDYYVSTQNSNISSYRSCLSISGGEYGYYGYGSSKGPVSIEAKTYRYSWNIGFFTGLLIYPIGWCMDKMVEGFVGLGLSIENGVPQILALIFMTLVVRIIMSLITFRSTLANQKMNALQPEMAKIQQKYPNSNTSQRERQLLAAEQQKLYKKYHINPMMSMLVMIVQFPVFLCVWGALQGSAYLSTGTFLGMMLSETISSILFNGANWSAPYGAVTALVIFLLMAGAQVFQMLLPRILQRGSMKKVSKTGKNPGQTQQQNRMKIFQWVMLAMIIIMGFFLVSAMCIYWMLGALIGCLTTWIMDIIGKRNIRNIRVKDARVKSSKK